MAQVQNMSIGERLQAVPKQVLYIILFVVASVPLFFPIALPNKPVDSNIDLYAQLMAIPDGSKVLLGSDWTNSTRGESLGEMECVLRILMRKNIKFAVYSVGDPQAPEVARNAISRISLETAKEGGKQYKTFDDYVSLGYFPSAEATLTSINNDIRAAFAGKKDLKDGVGATDVFQSPVFEGVKSVADFKALVLVTASDTANRTIERVKKVPLLFLVTGVMVPEQANYYNSGQLKGLCGGVKGVYDIEQMMEHGINNGGPDGVVSSKYTEPIPGWPGKSNKGMGTYYYLTLHFCLALLVLAVLTGNLGMYLARKKGR